MEMSPAAWAALMEGNVKETDDKKVGSVKDTSSAIWGTYSSGGAPLATGAKVEAYGLTSAELNGRTGSVVNIREDGRIVVDFPGHGEKALKAANLRRCAAVARSASGGEELSEAALAALMGGNDGGAGSSGSGAAASKKGFSRAAQKAARQRAAEEKAAGKEQDIVHSRDVQLPGATGHRPGRKWTAEAIAAGQKAAEVADQLGDALGKEKPGDSPPPAKRAKGDAA